MPRLRGEQEAGTLKADKSRDWAKGNGQMVKMFSTQLRILEFIPGAVRSLCKVVSRGVMRGRIWVLARLFWL